MKKTFVAGIPLLALTVVLSAALFARVAALPTNPRSMNARFIHWGERPHVIHTLPFADEGTFLSGVPAEVGVGQPVLFGFEWADGSVADLDAYVGNPDHDITVSVDGGAAFSVKDWYQDAFEATPGAGPRWSWDHDADGLGDGDGDGIDDWDGAVLFFRYQHPGLPAGTHTFVFELTDNGGIDWFLFDTITVDAS